MSYQCRKCFTLGDGRAFSDPDSGFCDACMPCYPADEQEIRDLILPYLNRYGQSDVGDLARAIRDVLDNR